MKKIIFITGVTRMKGEFVCISGLDEQDNFVRPQIQYPKRAGIKQEFLYVEKQLIIRPLAKVELEFLKPIPKSEFHTEDWEIDGEVKPRLISLPDDREKSIILSRKTDISLNQALAEKSRSIVIVKSRDIPVIEVRVWEDQIQCHLSFYDEHGDYHKRLRVTDANWLAACKYLWKEDKINIEARLTKALQNKVVFIRIGMTRKWEGTNWRQVSGVFSIPDWLKGKCFADFDYDFNDCV